MRRRLVVLAALSIAIAGPAWADDAGPVAPSGPAAPAAPTGPTGPATGAAPASATEEVMVGEVVTLPYNRSASYGPTRVVGPKIHRTDVGTGEWKGSIRNLDGVFRVTEKRISGANLNLVMERDADGWICQGTVDGNRVRISMEKDGFVLRYADRLYDMKRVAPDLWAGVPTGPGLRVKGDAKRVDPFYPQFIFALLAVL